MASVTFSSDVDDRRSDLTSITLVLVLFVCRTSILAFAYQQTCLAGPDLKLGQPGDSWPMAILGETVRKQT